MEEVFCAVCKRQLNTIPFIGEKYVKFEDGTYCQKCAKEKVDKERKKI